LRSLVISSVKNYAKFRCYRRLTVNYAFPLVTPNVSAVFISICALCAVTDRLYSYGTTAASILQRWPICIHVRIFPFCTSHFLHYDTNFYIQFSDKSLPTAVDRYNSDMQCTECGKRASPSRMYHTGFSFSL
jgi:hypothetical protein